MSGAEITVQTKRVYDPPTPADGERVLVMRFWPRGIRKDHIDRWERDLRAPPELIREWKRGALSWAQFAARYRKAMQDQGDKIADLAELAKTRTLTLLCGCRDEEHCHRSLLRTMIEKKTGGRRETTIRPDSRRSDETGPT